MTESKIASPIASPIDPTMFDGFKRRGSGKYVLFDLPTCDIRLQVVTSEGVKNAVISDHAQVAMLLDSIKRASNGKFVGIFQASHGEMIGGNCVHVPACVVPQRPTMANGGHDIYWNIPGEAMSYRLTIPLLGLTHLELLTKRDDIPSDKVLADDYDPEKAALVCR